MISGLVSVYKKGRQLPSVIRGYFVKAFFHPEFKKIAAEFFTEAAVLAFVFPVLDRIVEFGAEKVTTLLAFGSIVVAVFFLAIAGMLSRADKE